MVHGHVSLRNIMFGYGQHRGNNKNEGENTANLPDVTTTCTSGVWKHDDSQWKVDTNHPNIVEWSMVIYHWEI